MNERASLQQVQQDVIVTAATRLARRHFFLAAAQVFLSVSDQDYRYSKIKIWVDVLNNLHSFLFDPLDAMHAHVALLPQTSYFTKLAPNERQSIAEECRRIEELIRRISYDELGRARLFCCLALYGLMHVDGIRSVVWLSRSIDAMQKAHVDLSDRILRFPAQGRNVLENMLAPGESNSSGISIYESYEEVRVVLRELGHDVDELLDQMTPRLLVGAIE